MLGCGMIKTMAPEASGLLPFLLGVGSVFDAPDSHSHERAAPPLQHGQHSVKWDVKASLGSQMTCTWCRELTLFEKMMWEGIVYSCFLRFWFKKQGYFFFFLTFQNCIFCSFMVSQITVYFKMLYIDLFLFFFLMYVCVWCIHSCCLFLFACVYTRVWVHMNLYVRAYGGLKLLPDAFLAHSAPYSRRQGLSVEPRAWQYCWSS